MPPLDNLDLFPEGSPPPDTDTARPAPRTPPRLGAIGDGCGALPATLPPTIPAPPGPGPGATDGLRLAPAAIVLDPALQLRAVDDPIALRELVDSLHACGQLAPLVVRPSADGTGFRLVAGYRRHEAHARLLAEGRTSDRDATSRCAPELWVAVHALSDVEALRIAMAENQARADLCALDRAYEVGRARDVLAAEGGPPKIATLAKFVNRSRGSTSEQLRVSDHLPLAALHGALAPEIGMPVDAPSDTPSPVLARDASAMSNVLRGLGHRVLHRAATALMQNDPATARAILRRAARKASPSRGATPRRARSASSSKTDRPHAPSVAEPRDAHALDEARVPVEPWLDGEVPGTPQETSVPASLRRTELGLALVVRVQAAVASTAQCDEVLALIETLAAEVRGWRTDAERAGR